MRNPEEISRMQDLLTLANKEAARLIELEVDPTENAMAEYGTRAQLEILSWIIKDSTPGDLNCQDFIDDCADASL